MPFESRSDREALNEGLECLKQEIDTAIAVNNHLVAVRRDKALEQVFAQMAITMENVSRQYEDNRIK